MTKSKSSYLCLLVVLTGCAVTRQVAVTELQHPDGTIERRAVRSSAVALWDGKQTVDKLKVSNGKTQTIGLSGLDTESSSTNFAANLDAATRLLEKLRP